VTRGTATTGVLVAYASKHGATAEIAEAIAEELRHAGLSVECLPAAEVNRLEEYEAVVIGSAVYMKRWRPEARRLLKRGAKALAGRPFWMFSSGPCGEKPDPSWSEPARTVKRAEQLGVRDHVVFGGRLPLEPSNFMERSMVENCPPESRDLRDWDAIRDWAKSIASQLCEQPSASPVSRSAPQARR
jgi:menaquinone-dependent protoporphyrinogen oxidase